MTPEAVDAERRFSPSGGPATPTSSKPPRPVWPPSGATWWSTNSATNVPHIFAAGDVDGNSMLVSSATLEGRVAAENAVLGRVAGLPTRSCPAGSFTDPEYGGVGLTEEQARARYDCTVAVARYEDMLRPVADGHRKVSAS